MLLKRLWDLYVRLARRPWQIWGGCTDPELSRYVMDYAFGWLDNPCAVPELGLSVTELKKAFMAHLPECRRCQEGVRLWQAPLTSTSVSHMLVEADEHKIH